jgi:hypothetical protein
MKKLIPLFILILAALIVSDAGAVGHPPICQPDDGGLVNCEGDVVLILPWRFDLNTILTLRPNQEVVLGARWGACKKGLVTSFIPAARLDWLVDGYPLFGSSFDKAYDKEMKKQWGSVWADESNPAIDQCVMNTEETWWSYWTYSLGTLAPGDHPVQLNYWLSRPARDGGDYDGDGKMDVFEGELAAGKILIRVENP